MLTEKQIETVRKAIALATLWSLQSVWDASKNADSGRKRGAL